jgi:hypothetical protein
MRFVVTPLALLVLSGSAAAFTVGQSSARRSSSLSMVLEKPKTKKLQKIESLKVKSDHLIHPLIEVGHSVARDRMALSFVQSGSYRLSA